MKCAFIGISNWALDPAKMNRGIFIQVGSPASNELEEIARLVNIVLLFCEENWIRYLIKTQAALIAIMWSLL